jgi:GNAT superfamily N-acetyltransferase
MALIAQETYKLNLTITFRLATQADLPKLEWYGQYTHFRPLFERTYREQCAGSRLMLIADMNGFPIGQIFVLLRMTPNLARRHRITPQTNKAYLYSLRVMDHLQGKGIGTQLILLAEALLMRRGYEWTLISVAKTNPRARQLYERLGYHVFCEDPGEWRYVNHQGKIVHMTEPCWMLDKRLKSN